MEEDIKRLGEIVSEAKDIISRLEGRMKQYEFTNKYDIQDIELLIFFDNMYNKYPEYKKRITRFRNVCCWFREDIKMLSDLLQYTPGSFSLQHRCVGKKCVSAIQDILMKELGIEWK